MKIEVPKFEKKEELFAWLKENKEDIVYQKKSERKFGDATFGVQAHELKPSKAVKSADQDVDNVKVRAVINTTNVMDSHGDVHIKGLWKKTVNENKRIKHLQEHDLSFKSIIADKEDLKVFTKEYSWKELGYDSDGTTEALVFDSNVKKSRNSYMFEQYKSGNVDNHSVGMVYVNMKLAINSDDEDYKEEKEVYDKHIDSILNKDEVERKGHFWAVYEAKAIEGSAVVIGSNQMTPTLQSKEDVETEEEKMNRLRVEAYKKWLTEPS
jgi:hypothetical protein